jgi:hypothetical protein
MTTRHLRILIFASIFLSAPFFASVAARAAGVAFVQANANKATQTTSSSISFSSRTASGDLILVGMDFDKSVTPTISDSQGNSYTEVGSQLTTANGNHSRVYYAKKIVGGSDTVKVSMSGTTDFIEIYLTEYSGANQTTPIDAQAAATGSAGSVSSGSATTTGSDLVYGFCLADSACNAGSGFSARSTLVSNLIEDKSTSTAGTYAATASANSGWTMQMVAVKPASNTPAVSNPPSITSATSASGTVGSAFSYQITATNSPTSYAASGLPGGVSVNTSTGAISGTPTASGTSSVTLSATNSAGTGRATLALTIAAASGSGAKISSSSSSVAFGSVTVNTKDSLPITLTNSGGATLTFSQVTVSGSGFGETGLSTSTTIAAGKSASFNVTFDPSAAGAASGTVSLATNGTPSSLAISLSGTGLAATASLSASPSTLSFGNVLDDSSGSLSTTLTNTGNASVTISSVTLSGKGFTAAGSLAGTVLGAGQSVALSVKFDPTSGGAVSGSVSVASNATGSPTAVSLSGTGMHSVVLSWGASPTGGVTYNVYRGTSSGKESSSALTSGVTSTSYTDTNVTPGTNYYYTVKAVDSGGTSAASNEAVADVPNP